MLVKICFSSHLTSYHRFNVNSIINFNWPRTLIFLLLLIDSCWNWIYRQLWRIYNVMNPFDIKYGKYSLIDEISFQFHQSSIDLGLIETKWYVSCTISWRSLDFFLTFIDWITHRITNSIYLLSLFASSTTDEAAQYGHHLLLLLISFFLHWFLNIAWEVRQKIRNFSSYSLSYGYVVWPHSPSTDKTCVLSWISKNTSTPTTSRESSYNWNKNVQNTNKSSNETKREKENHKKFRFFLPLHRPLKSFCFPHDKKNDRIHFIAAF